MKKPPCPNNARHPVIKTANAGQTTARWWCRRCCISLGAAGKPDRKTVVISHLVKPYDGSFVPTKRQMKKVVKRFNAGEQPKQVRKRIFDGQPFDPSTPVPPNPVMTERASKRTAQQQATYANELAHQRLREAHAKVLRAKATLMQAKAERALAGIALNDTRAALEAADTIELAELRRDESGA